MLSTTSSDSWSPAVSARRLGLVEPGGVGEAEHDVPDARSLLDHVPGGAGNARDDAPLPLQEPVHQRRLPDVRPPDNGGLYSFGNGLSGVELSGESIELVVCGLEI